MTAAKTEQWKMAMHPSILKHAPKREDFLTQEEYEEALAFFKHRRMDREQMNDAVRMQHERDMQERDHAADAVKLAMQLRRQGK